MSFAVVVPALVFALCCIPILVLTVVLSTIEDHRRVARLNQDRRWGEDCPPRDGSPRLSAPRSHDL